MPGPGVRQGNRVIRRGTGGAPRRRRDVTRVTPTRPSVALSRPIGTSGPTRAARQFVDKHVSIDSHGFPSLLPSAVQGISHAVDAVQHPSAATSVAQTPRVPTITGTPAKGPFSADTPAEIKAAQRALRGKKLPATVRTPKSVKTQEQVIQHQTKALKSPPKFGRHQYTGGAYELSMGIGKGGRPLDTSQTGSGPVQTAFKVAGTAAAYAPVGAGLSQTIRGGLKLGLSRVAREEAANLVKTQGVKAAGSQAFPRVARAVSAAKRAPSAIREAPTAIRGAARRTPATVATVASTPEGRVAVARQIAHTAYHYKASTGIALSSAAKQAGISAPGVDQVNAFVTGTKNALTNKPLHTLKTTARALPGAITAPVALGASGVESAIHGNIGPLKQEATTQFEGAFFHKGPKRGILEKMLSGDPKVVEKAVANEGGLAFLPLVPGISRTGPYKDVRSQVRAGAAASRRFMEPVLRENRGRVLGVPVRPRLSPKGVERPVFRAAERRQEGLRIAKIRAREEGPFKLAAAEHGNAVVHAAGRLPKKMKEGHVAEALQTLLANGIRDKKGVDYIRKHGPTSEVVPEGGINLKAALDIMDAHPEMWKDKRVQNLIAAGERMSDTTPAQMAGSGEVARVREQAAAHRNRYQSEGKPIPPALRHPSEQVPPEARALTTATTREGAWEHVKNLEKKGETQRAKQLRTALDKYTRPEHSQDWATTSRTPYTEPMMREHVAAVEAENKKVGLAPGRYTHHAMNQEAAVGLGVNPYPRAPGGLEHSSAASDNPESLAARDLVDRSLVAFIKGTGELPRRRAAGKEFARGVTRDAIGSRFPVKVEGETKNVVGPENERMITRDEYARVTSPKTEQNPEGGQYDRKSMGFFPYNEVKNALDNPFTTEADFQGLLEQAAKQDTAGHRGELGFLMPRRAIEEWRHQIQGDLSKVSRGMSSLAGVATAGILGTNPTWAMVQIPAEGIPLALAHPSVLWKAPAIELSLRQIRKKSPESAYWLEGSMGANPTRAGAVRRAEQTTGGYGQQEAPNGETLAEQGKQLTRGPLARAFDSAIHLRPLRTFDVRRQREQSVVAAITVADKRFRSLHSHLKSLVGREAGLAGKFYGRPRSEMLDWLANTTEGRAEWRGIREDLYNTLGNWDAFTQLEREAAPFTIFYTFLRYAVQWPLWLFPRSHPVTATITYFLAQQNANRLEKIAGMPHGLSSGDEYLYALPVYTSSKMKDGRYTQATLPVGTRISPGQSVIQGALMSKNPAQTLGSANPFVGAVITGLTGTTPFGTQTSQPKGWAALNQLIPGLSALRYVPGLNAQKVVTAITTGHATNDPASLLSQAFDRLDPNRRLRSFGAPWIPLSGAKFKQREQLTNALQTAHNNRYEVRQHLREDYATKVANAKGQMKHKLFNEGVLKDEAMKAKATGAGATIDRILSDLGLGVQNKKQFAAYLGITKMAEPPFGQTAHAPTGPTTTSAGTGKPPPAGQNAAFTTSHFPQPPKTPQLQLAASTQASPTKSKVPKLSGAAKEAGLDPAKAAALKAASAKSGVPVELLAAIGHVETTNGTSSLPGVHSGTNSAGAAGPFQFLKSSWDTVAQQLWGRKAAQHSVYNYADAAQAAGQYLKNAGFKANDPSSVQKAVFSYNHSSSYVNEVLSRAQQLRGAVQGGGKVVARVPTGRFAHPFPTQYWSESRTDQGKDFAPRTPNAPVLALGNATVMGKGQASSWASGGGGGVGDGIVYKLKNAKGLPSPYVFVYEGVLTDKNLKPGTHIRKGQVIGKAAGSGSSLEMGFASGPDGHVLTPYNGAADGTAMPAGIIMSKLLDGLRSGKKAIKVPNIDALSFTGGAFGSGGGAFSGFSGGSSNSGGFGTVSGMQGGLSSKYTPPDYTGLTAASHSLSPISGIVKGTGSSSLTSLIGGTRATSPGPFGSLTATGTPLSAAQNLAKLPRVPTVTRRRRRSTTSSRR